MKIVVNGYSGSGKSTLAGRLGELYQIPVLHLDTVHWLPGWEEKAEEQERSEVRAFMDRNASWVIDGNYRKLEYERRLQEADRIIFMDFNRFSCLFRAYRRYLDHKGRARSSMTEGCEEKLDLEFIRWILWDSRTRKQKKLWQAMKETCGGKNRGPEKPTAAGRVPGIPKRTEGSHRVPITAMGRSICSGLL